MSRYQRVRWHHDLTYEPVVLYSEIDDAGVETRKVDEYKDGRLDFADANRSTGSTFLSEKTMPGPHEITAQAEFSGEAISQEEFEEIWRRATANQ